jgi:predicted negative regulator of RcsB-dependent stress response
VDELLSEKEQIDRMRVWWSDYGFYVIGGVVLGAAILFGFNYYESAEIAAQEEASAMYDTLTANIADADLEAAEKSREQFLRGAVQTCHGATVYGQES